MRHNTRMRRTRNFLLARLEEAGIVAIWSVVVVMFVVFVPLALLLRAGHRLRFGKGPKQLPKLGRALGESIREFRGAGRELVGDHEDKPK